MCVCSIYSTSRGGRGSMVLDRIQQGGGRDQENTILKGISKMYGPYELVMVAKLSNLVKRLKKLQNSSSLCGSRLVCLSYVDIKISYHNKIIIVLTRLG